MSETTMLAIITVACTAGSALLTVILQLLASGIKYICDGWRERKKNQLSALTAYAEIVFRSNYSPSDDAFCHALGSIYIYVGRKQRGLIDSINLAVMDQDRDKAIALYSQLLRSLKIPRVHMRTTSPNVLPK